MTDRHFTVHVGGAADDKRRARLHSLARTGEEFLARNDVTCAEYRFARLFEEDIETASVNSEALDVHACLHDVYRGPEADAASAPLREIGGTIKWFDLRVGYGFVIRDDGQPDVILPVGALRAARLQVAPERARIDCFVSQDAKGARVEAIVGLDTTTAIDPERLPRGGEPAADDIGPWRMGVVVAVNSRRTRWTIQFEGRNEAVSLLLATARRCGLAWLDIGDALAVRCCRHEGKLIVAEVASHNGNAPPSRCD